LDWDWLAAQVARNGIRNAWLLAIAPTGSSSVIVGSTASADPVYQRYFIEEKKGMVIPQTAPDLSAKTFFLFKEAFTIDQKWSIDAAGIRAKYIDQGQSFNLYIDPDKYEGPDGTVEYFNLFIRAWDKGVKSIYYVRNKSKEMSDDCVACSA
jgi:ribonucleoside-diphosphate reductase alpha chain